MRENAKSTEILSLSLSRGDITAKDGSVGILDLVKMKRYADEAETASASTLPFAHMNANGVVSVDDIDLHRYRLLGFTKESDIKR